MNAFVDFLEKRDWYGTSMKLTLFHKEKQKSWVGGVFTIFMIIFMIMGVFLVYYDMLETQLDFQLIDIPDVDTPLQLNNVTLHICPVNQNDVSMWQFGNIINFNHQSENPIKPYQCSLISEDDSLNNLFKNCYCYNLETHNLTDSNNINKRIISIGSISYTKLSSSSSSQDQSSDVCLFYTKHYVDIINFNLQVKEKQQMQLIQNVNGQDLEINFFAEKINIEKKEWGFKLSEKNSTNIHSVNIQTTKTESEKGLITLKFVHSGWMKKYKSSPFNLAQMLFDLGGLYEFMSLFNCLVKKGCKVDILKKAIKKNKSLKHKQTNAMIIDLEQMRKNAFNEFELENMKNEQQPVVLDSESIINKSARTINKTFDPPVFMLTNSVHENESVKIHIKKEKDTQSTFDYVSQFKRSLDLKHIYQIIKEVKLLELICLNQREASLFFNCKNCQIDLKQLKQYTKNASLDCENEYSMDSFMNKIEILQTCIKTNKDI